MSNLISPIQPIMIPSIAGNSGIFATGGGGGGAEWGPYASLSAAESSGDLWLDNDIITITGGPDFIYHSNYATEHHSGLIHRYPFNGAFEASGGVAYVNTPLNVDPDTWTGWTNYSAAPYTLHVVDGYSRIDDGGNSGWADMRWESALGAADRYKFFVLSAQALLYSGTGTYFRISMPAYQVGANRVSMEVAFHSSGSNKWSVMDTWFTWPGTDSGVSVLDMHRIWGYIDAEDKLQALWFDGDSTPAVNLTQVPETVGADPNFQFRLLGGDGGIFFSQVRTQYVTVGNFAAVTP